MFSLHRLYAFSISPQRGASDSDLAEPPDGGAVAQTPEVEQVINAAFAKVLRSSLTTVDFDFNESREHEVRANVMLVAFGATQAPRAAASRLALRLARTMDQRSHPALLVLVVEENDLKRRVSLLLFPREDVVQLEGVADERLLSLLRNAFSTGSKLRKLARMEGHNAKSQFLSVEILDFQLGSPHKSTADFWVTQFLGAKPRIDAKTASRQLAGGLQRAFEAADQDERDAVYAAMFKARSGRVTRTSLKRWANDLPKSLHAAFFQGVPDHETREAVFDIDHALMKDILARREITTTDGVVISAPQETIGKSLELQTEGSARWVKYHGSVERERVMRSRRGQGSRP